MAFDKTKLTLRARDLEELKDLIQDLGQQFQLEPTVVGCASFDGRPATPVIYAIAGVLSVTKLAVGQYRITHASKLRALGIQLVGTVVDATQAHLQPFNVTADYTDIQITTLPGVLFDPVQCVITLYALPI